MHLVLWIIQQTGWHHCGQKCMSTSISLSLVLSNMKFFSTIIILSSAERDHYYNNRLRAEKDPQKCVPVITVDGMDQAKTNIPHVISMSKASSNVSWKKICQSLTISWEWNVCLCSRWSRPTSLKRNHRSNLSWTESNVFRLTSYNGNMTPIWHSMCYSTYLLTLLRYLFVIIRF